MIKTSTPADTDTGAAIIAQLLSNDKQNLTQDENAVLNSGISEGMVVKWSSSQSKWLICDGTVALLDTDSIGIVTYADGTSGQVKTSGVYVNDDLSTVGKYYCQSDGSIGTTITKVFIGNITSPGRLCLPGGSGGGGNIATTTSLGQVMIGGGINVNSQGKISSPPHGSQIFNASGTFTVPTGITTVYLTGCAGGGGSGGGDAVGNGYGGGGGAGACVLGQGFSVTAGQTYHVTIGGGGAGVANTASVASNGGPTSFGSLLSLQGGRGGSGVDVNSGKGGESGGWLSAPGSYGIKITDGTNIPIYRGNNIFSTSASLDSNGGSYGAGGGPTTNAATAYNGGPGFLIVEW